MNITEFIHGGLTDPRVANELPPFDRPTLRSELGPEATLFASGQAGTGGFEPNIVAASPAMLGNNEFRVGVNGALGGASALLVLSMGLSTPSTTGLPPYGVAVRFALPFTLSGMGPGGGYATWNRNIPAIPALAGSRIVMQWLVADPGATNGIAASQRALTTIF